MKEKLTIPKDILTIKDRKILRELFANGRTPFSRVAKRVGLSKEVVSYRVKRLVKKGILKGTNTVLNVHLLGWQSYFIHVRLRNIDNNREKQILDKMTHHPNVAQVLKCMGNYDVTLKAFVKKYSDVAQLMKHFEVEFNPHIDQYITEMIEEEFPVPIRFLYEPFESKQVTIKQDDPLTASTIDLNILNVLANNARVSASDIGKKLGISGELVRYHIKKLEQSIITTYRPSAWSGSKSLGFSWYMVFLRINEIGQNTVKEYITTHPNTTYCYATAGAHDIVFEIRLKTGDELKEVLMDIREILGENLISHELLTILEETKYTYVPRCVVEGHSKS